MLLVLFLFADGLLLVRLLALLLSLLLLLVVGSWRAGFFLVLMCRRVDRVRSVLL